MPMPRHGNSNGGLLLRIVLPALLTLTLFIVALFLIVIPRFEDIIIGRKREMIRELTQAAWHVADHYRQKAESGLLPEEEARLQAIAQLRHLRYGDEGKDYFWITDFRPVMIDHPFRPDLNGSDLSSFTDSKGKRLFVEIARVVRADGEGYVDYTWQWKDDSSRIVPKLSYVREFSPWGWIIGTGIYIEDVKEEIAGLERNVITIATWITVSVSLLLLLIVVQNLRSERRRLRAENELREAKEKYEALAESTTEGLLMLLDGEQMYFNRTMLDLTGYSEDEARDLALSDLFPDADPASLAVLGQHGDGADTETGPIETRLRHRDGHGSEVMLTASRVRYFGKSAAVITVKDMRQHKEMSTALDESRQKFMSLSSQLSLAVFRTDAELDLCVLEANRATIGLFGYTGLEQVLGMPFSERFEESAVRESLFADVREHGFVAHRLARVHRVDGSAVDLSLSVALVRDEEGDPRFFDVLAEDVSGDVRKEEYAGVMRSELQAPLLFLQQPLQCFAGALTECSAQDTAGTVDGILRRTGAGAVLVHDAEGRHVGIVGPEELRRASVAARASGVQRAVEIMRSPVPRLGETATVYDLLSLHEETGASMAVLTDEQGAPTGTVMLDRVQRSRLHTHMYFLRHLTGASSVAEVRHVLTGLRSYLRLLIDGGAGVQAVTHATSMVYDSAVRRVIELVTLELGPPPVAYSFIALGSQGRGEQTLATDQDNALIYADVGDGGAADGRSAADVASYFRSFGTRVCRELDRIGFPYCKGEVMAMNPKWCQPLSAWKTYFTDWVGTANPQDLLDVNIFFDFRFVHGDRELTTALCTHLHRQCSGNNSFFVYLTQNALRYKAPSSQLKSTGTFDVKAAMVPIVDLVRIYALRHGVRENNTLRRMQLLHDQDVFSSVRYRDLTASYELLLALRFRNQARQLGEHATPDNLLHVALLSEADKAMLRRVLTQVEDFRAKLSLDFKGTM